MLSAVGSSGGDYGTQIVPVTEASVTKTSLQAVTNLTPTYTGNTRGNGAVDLQQSRSANSQVASGYYSVAMGGSNTASSYYSVAMGYMNTASGNYSVAMGDSNTASSYYSVAMGDSNTASGGCSVAMGGSNTASGNYSVAMGSTNTASGYSSVAMGNNNNDNSHANSFLIGVGNKTYVDGALVTGKDNINAVSGAVCNNTSPYVGFSASQEYDKYGNCGFFGRKLAPNKTVTLFNLNTSTDNIVARIDLLYGTFVPVSVMFWLAGLAGKFKDLTEGSTTSDSYTNGIFTLSFSNGSLTVTTPSLYPSQIGVFYTLYTSTLPPTQDGSSSSSSSS